MGGLEFRSSIIMHKYENTLFGGGEGALWALWLYVKYILKNVLHLILGFIFGVGAWYFYFHKFNAI
jgi:hypothetical protein